MPRSGSSRKETPAQVAAGVEQLIARLRDQGVEAGRSQADQMVAEARQEAQRTVDNAHMRYFIAHIHRLRDEETAASPTEELDS